MQNNDRDLKGPYVDRPLSLFTFFYKWLKCKANAWKRFKITKVCSWMGQWFC